MYFTLMYSHKHMLKDLSYVKKFYEMLFVYIFPAKKYCLLHKEIVLGFDINTANVYWATRIFYNKLYLKAETI